MPASIFNGTAVKILKDRLRFKTSTEIIAGDTDDPTSVAKDAPQGSLYLRSGTKNVFTKNDAGSTTNWTEFIDEDSVQTLLNKTLTLPKLNDLSSDHTFDFVTPELAADRILNFPLLLSADTLVTEDHIQTLTNKTLTLPVINVNDDEFTIQDDGDATKVAIFQASAITTATTRTFSFHDENGVLVLDTGTQILTNKTLTAPLITTNGTIDVTAAGTLNIGDSVGANNLTIGGASSTVVIPGDLQVDGTTTSVNSSTLEVTDANILVNNGGNQAAANSQIAGLTVEMSDATDAVFGYDSTLTSKWKLGESAAEAEVVTVSHTQTMTNKTLTSPTINTPTMDVVDDQLSIKGSGDATKIVQFDVDSVTTSTTRTIIIPDINDTMVTLTATQILSNKTLTLPQINDTSSDHQYIFGVSELVADRTVTLPLLIGNDVFVFNDHIQTLTNKTLTLPVININDDEFTIQDDGDATKIIAFQASGITTGNTRTLTAPDKSITLIGIEDVFSVQAIAATGPLTANESYIADSSGGAITLTLPAPATDIFVRVKDIGNAGTNNITISPNGAEKIDTVAANHIMVSDLESKVFVSNGTDWFIM